MGKWSAREKHKENYIYRRYLAQNHVREASALVGLSYYSIIIKPLLKIYSTEFEHGTKSMIEYYKEACKNALKIWITKPAEPNNTHPRKK